MTWWRCWWYVRIQTIGRWKTLEPIKATFMIRFHHSSCYASWLRATALLDMNMLYQLPIVVVMFRLRRSNFSIIVRALFTVCVMVASPPKRVRQLGSGQRRPPRDKNWYVRARREPRMYSPPTVARVEPGSPTATNTGVAEKTGVADGGPLKQPRAVRGRVGCQWETKGNHGKPRETRGNQARVRVCGCNNYRSDFRYVPPVINMHPVIRILFLRTAIPRAHKSSRKSQSEALSSVFSDTVAECRMSPMKENPQFSTEEELAKHLAIAASD